MDNYSIMSGNGNGNHISGFLPSQPKYNFQRPTLYETKRASFEDVGDDNSGEQLDYGMAGRAVMRMRRAEGEYRKLKYHALRQQQVFLER